MGGMVRQRNTWLWGPKGEPKKFEIYLFQKHLFMCALYTVLVSWNMIVNATFSLL